MKKMKKLSAVLLLVIMLLMLCSCGSNKTESDIVFSTSADTEETNNTNETESVEQTDEEVPPPENFVLISGGICGNRLAGFHWAVTYKNIFT